MNFIEELQRRNVIKVGIAYAVVAWLVLQFSDVILNNIEAPGWVFQAIMLVLGIGFALALFFSWAFEMTPEGIKKEKDVDRSQSITHKTGRKLDFLIIGVLVLVAGYFIWESRFTSEMEGPQSVSAETTAAPAENANSIAVLPFANRSNQADDLFFTDGIHDDLLTQLAKINGLKVISRTSVMEYRDTTKKIAEIAKELGVTKILEGGVQRAGKRIRINAQLIDVATDRHLWAETFDREMTMDNIFDIQTEITRQIVTAVKGELSQSDQQSLGENPTNNLQAWEAFLHARAATQRPDYGKEKYIEAQPWAERAVNLDPQFAEAWALLSEIHGQAYWIGYDRSEQRIADAKSTLATAVELKPESAVVKAAQADYLYRFDSDYAKALEMYMHAQQLAPGDAQILSNTAVTQRRLGMWVESINSFEKARQLDPANISIVTTMVDTLGLMNEWQRVDALAGNWVIRYPESRDLRASQIRAKIRARGDLKLARELFDLVPPWTSNTYVRIATDLPRLERNYDAWLEALDKPEIVNYTSFGGVQQRLMSKGMAHHFMGELETAQSYLLQVVEKQDLTQISPTFMIATKLASKSLAYMYLGETTQALAASHKALETLPVEKDHLFGSIITRNHTLILAMAGQREEALERLAVNIDAPEGYARWELYLDPAWDFFRDDEQFNELIKPLNLNEAPQ